MANISLEAAIRTCKVDTAYSNKVQSDRFLNPSLMVCPVWNGVDTTGRQVCPDSFYTKNAGCNSAEDRVMVENSVSRPQYMEYINLSANGIDGNIYGNTMPWNEVGQTSAELQAINNVTGNFGLQFGANTYPGCNYYPYEQALSQEKNAAQTKEMYNYQNMMNQSSHMMNQEQHMMANPQHMMAQPQHMKMQNQARQTHLSHQQVNEQMPMGGGGVREGFQNLARNPSFTAPSQRFAQNQQNFRQQGALNNAFIRNDFRRSGGN
jgi:hypothetical protein